MLAGRNARNPRTPTKRHRAGRTGTCDAVTPMLSCSPKPTVLPHDDILDPGSLPDGAAAQAVIATSSGMAPVLRQAMWPPLLGLAPWPSAPHHDPDEHSCALQAEYAELVSRVGTVDPSLVRTIDADVPRTDADFSVAQEGVLREMLLAHCVLKPKWGYFQGMNDIARVIIAASASPDDPSIVGATPPCPSPRGQCLPAATEGREPCAQSTAPSVAGKADVGVVLGDGRAFQLLRGVLMQSADNFAHPKLAGVWRQARAVRAILRVADPKLARKVEALDGTGSVGARGMPNDQPLAFLFGPIFLRLKRELVDLEEAMRLWEVCWACGRHFHVVAIAAFVCMQRKAVLALRGGMSEVHVLFGRLGKSQRAAPLLTAARRLQRKPRVLEALEEAMGSSLGK